MDTKLLLVKAITLLYLQSIIPQPNRNTTELISNLLEVIKSNSETINTDFGHDVISRLRETLVWMDTQPNGHSFDIDLLKQRFTIDSQGESYILQALNAMFDYAKKEEDDIIKHMRAQEYEIRQYLNRLKAAQVLKEFYIKAQFKSSGVDWSTLMVDLENQLSPYVSSGTGSSAYNHPSVVSTVDFDNKQSVMEAMQSSKDELSIEGVLQTPYQGLNRMLGPHRGMRRGEFIVFPALQHMYKSGMMLDIFAGVPILNKPFLKDPNKKPLNLRISFENKREVDIKTLYERFYEMDNGIRANMANVSIDEASDYVMSKLDVNGWHNKIIHIDPSDYSYFDLFSLIEQFEDDGYEIQLLSIDYLSMMSKKGCNQGPAGTEFIDLFRRVRNFTSKKNITCITPHQLSTESKYIQRQGQSNFVREVAGKGYYESAKGIDREVDTEIYMHIEQLNGESFLTIHRGKCRGVRIEKVEYLYTVYKFNPDTGIPWDVNGPDQSRKSVGGDTMADGGATAWFDTV